MEDLEKLSCKEEMMENSDLDHSATDEHREVEEKPKKKKRRRREVDMIKLSDDDETDEEGIPKKLFRHLSPGPNSPASHREPRTCVLKASQKRRPLSRLLEQLLRNLEKRDPNQFFAWPVNDNFAPNYSNIIRRPMDFSTMKQKIDDNEYKSLNCFISDFKLMCNNAMKYNKNGTVYHKAAKRLLHAGLKQLTPQKLRPLGDILTYMYEIPIKELGFDMGKMDVKVLKRNSPLKSGGSEAETASDGAERPSPGDCRKMQMEAARELHRRRLAKKAFPRMDAEGKTTLALVTAGAGAGAGEGGAAAGAGGERLTLGRMMGKLTTGTGALHTPREDRRNIAKCVKPLNYGPFSSFAPSYDGTFATLTREESHLIYHTLPSETGQGNEELLRFAPDSPWAAIYDMPALFPDKKTADTTAHPAHTGNEELLRFAPDSPWAAIYDMPALFPDKKTADTTAHPAHTDLSKVKVDVDKLRTLSSLGIDVEFLNEMEDEIIQSQHDYGIAPALKHTHDLIVKLEKEQRDRLSQPPPWHLSLVQKPSGTERELARLVTSCLRGMAARVQPKHVAPLQAVRKAMGVTLDHLDTPMAVDDFEEKESRERDLCSDPESRSSHDK